MANIDNMRGDTLRVVEENTLDNMRGATQRVISENSIDNTRGVTYRVYNVNPAPAPVIDELNVTPSTSAQTITAPEGTDGYSPVNVSAVTSSIDANIQAGNIKKDVTILGVTGSYEAPTPTGTINITTNGTHDVSSYANASVAVPTTAPDYYIEFTKDANNKLVKGNTIINLNGITDIGNSALYYAYYSNTNITGSVNLSSLTQITGQNAISNCFSGCTGLTGTVDLSSVTLLQGQGCLQSAFYGCTGLTGFDMGALERLPVGSSCYSVCNNCTGLTTVNLKSLKQITGNQALQYAFSNCSSLTSVDLSSLEVISGQNDLCSSTFARSGLTSIDLSSLTYVGKQGYRAMNYMFTGCSALANVDLSHLCYIGSSNVLQYTFQGCASLTSLSFNNLAYTTLNFDSSFLNMLQGCSGVTVHFPAEWQTTMSSWSNVTNGFGGTNTTVLFDLPNVTTLDLTHLTKITLPDIYGSVFNANCFPNVTKIDMKNVTEITGQQSCSSMFYNGTSITEVDLSSLETVGVSSCASMFGGCTALTTVNLSSLKKAVNHSCNSMFANCTSLTSLSLPSLVSFTGTSFYNMLNGVTGCTVHLPSNLSGSGIGFGGTNTTILFDLPATE